MTRKRHHRSPFWRYTAFQIPGWILATIGGWWLHVSLDISAWVAQGMLVMWVIKDIALYPFLRSAYEVDDRQPIERLIGERGTTVEPLAPSGYVRVGGELWYAETKTESEIKSGVGVQITDAKGLMLTVCRTMPNSPEDPRKSFPVLQHPPQP